MAATRWASALNLLLLPCRPPYLQTASQQLRCRRPPPPPPAAPPAPSDREPTDPFSRKWLLVSCLATTTRKCELGCVLVWVGLCPLVSMKSQPGFPFYAWRGSKYCPWFLVSGRACLSHHLRVWALLYNRDQSVGLRPVLDATFSKLTQAGGGTSIPANSAPGCLLAGPHALC